MSLITLHNVGQSFGDFDVFDGLSASVPHRAHIGLVGTNGIGKTTLLRLLAGLDQPARGHINRARGLRLGYVCQEAPDAFAVPTRTLYDEMLTVFAEARALEARLRETEILMAQRVIIADALEQYGRLHDQFELAGGYRYEAQIAATLCGLGFDQEIWQQPINQLSGGQKTRALLARRLLERPDLLLLDEPTDYLDIRSVEWLEYALREWQGAVLVVSHNRCFLDQVAVTIWELSRSAIISYPNKVECAVEKTV